MATQTLTKPEQDQSVEQKLQQVRKLYANAPEMAKRALENTLPALRSQAAEAQDSRSESAGRIGTRLGKVSELTLIARFAPGGAQRLRAMLQLLNGCLTAQALHVVAALGIADRLAAGPATVDDLAAATGAHRPSLNRLLRMLTGVGVFCEERDGRFKATAKLTMPLGGQMVTGQQVAAGSEIELSVDWPSDFG